MQKKEDFVAEEHADSDTDPDMHPLATEEWLGSLILEAIANPQAVCQLNLVNKNFHAASKSNLVWRKLLPPPFHSESLTGECDDQSLQHLASLSQKDLYFHLCKPISLGGGLKKFWLDQKTGGECYMISAKALSIAWGSTPLYWSWQPCPGAWFPEVAYLNYVFWFDIAGKFRQLLKPGNYVVSFRMQIHKASVWDRSPIKLSLQNVTYAQPLIKSTTFFHNQFRISNPPIASPPVLDVGQPSTTDHNHVWIECDVGEFTVEVNERSPIELEFSMREVEVLGCKTGFVLDGILIRPSYVVNNAHSRASCSVGDHGDGKEDRKRRPWWRG